MKKYFALLHIHLKSSQGYTITEMMIVISIFLTLIGVVSVNLFKFQHKSQLSSTINSFLADYEEQQMKAMIGDTEGTMATADYGVHIETTTYTLFRNTYGTANFPISLPSGTQFTTTLPNSQILFLRGSGEVSGFTTGQNTITFQDTGDNSQKTITVNRYGVVVSVN